MTPAQKALMEKMAALRKAKEGVKESVPKHTATEGGETAAETPTKEPEKTVCAERESGNIPVSEASKQSHEPVQETTSQPVSSTSFDHPIKMQLAELQDALEQRVPEFKTILRDIHGKLRADPEIVTLLTDEEIGGILTGLKHHAQVDVIAPKAASTAKKAAKAKIANMTADDL